MIFVGIDPGVSGGIAIVTSLDEYRGVALYSFAGRTLADVLVILSCGHPGLAVGVIEEVHAMPGQGVVSMFTFGRSYGQLEALAVAAHLPLRRVRPQRWQRDLGLLSSKSETKTQKKNRHKALAQELYPGVKITHATADALLLSEWLRRQELAGTREDSNE